MIYAAVRVGSRCSHWRKAKQQAALLPAAKRWREGQAKRAESTASGWLHCLLFRIGKERKQTGMLRSEAEQQANILINFMISTC